MRAADEWISAKGGRVVFGTVEIDRLRRPGSGDQGAGNYRLTSAVSARR
jgi:hypothetical protein